MSACPSPFVRCARGAMLGLVLGCALAGAGAARAEEMGRLFFTPQQRQDLDRRRSTNVPEPEAGVESLVTVNGQVSRSSGRTTTWINGVPQYDAYRGRSADRVAIDSGSAAVGVKVGQTLDRGRGQVQDPLQGGTVSVKAQGAR